MSREYRLLIEVGGSWDTLHGEEVEEMLTANVEGHGIRLKEIHPVDKDETFPDDAGVLGLIRKLYRGYYNTNLDTEIFTTEFYYLVGEVLKGKKLGDLKAKYLKLDELKEALHG
jgi:hypothetical protein